MKATVWGQIISAMAYKKKERHKTKNQILCNIKTLENKHKLYGSNRVYRKLLAERRALEILETTNIKCNLFYLRQQYWIKTPKALRLLAWRVRQKKAENMILALKDKDGLMQVMPQKIAQVMAAYYKDVYVSRNPATSDISRFFDSLTVTCKLSDDHRHMLDAPITEEEVLNVIKKLKTKKTPGVDGFPSEFYKAFAEVLVDPMVGFFNHVSETGNTTIVERGYYCPGREERWRPN